VASSTDTLSQTGTGEQSSQDRPERTRRTVVWASVAAALLAVAGLAYATFVAGDDPAPSTPTSVEVQGTDDLPGSHNVPR